MRPVNVKASERVADLWSRTLLLVSHDAPSARNTGSNLLGRLLARERARLSRKHGPGWIERIEREYYKPKRKPSATTAPPPAPDSFID